MFVTPGQIEMPQLNEIAHPRPREAAQNRAPRAFMIDENELRRLESGDEDVVRRQVAVDISGAMQARDLRAERPQNCAPRRELRQLQVTHNTDSVDARGHYDLAAATLLDAEQQNLRDSHGVGPQTLQYRCDVRGAPALEHPPDPIQAANRVEHFEIRVRTPDTIEMLEPRLGVARTAYASCQRAVDRPERGIDQALAKLL